MTHETNLVTVSQFDGNAYLSSQVADQTLNAAILRAEIARSHEEFLEIFDKFYADDVEVSSEGSSEPIRGKASVRLFFEFPGAASHDGRGCRIVDISSADYCSSRRG